MCGIAGYVYGRRVDAGVIRGMVAALRHRGPDADGFHRSGGFAAGMRRLSINDLKGGDQPLFNEDRSVVLFYNGEIYNSPQLRRQLEKRGHRFGTRCDGEVICHLYEEEGEELFSRLDGMFAAALWIDHERRLVLARDVPGEKPLYYAPLSDTEVAFASEIKSLRLFPFLSLTLDRQAVWDFPTFLWIPEPDTVYREVRALPRGHLLIVDDRGTTLRPYHAGFRIERVEEDDEAVVAETRRVVTEAVRSRLLSDVPIGCFLSGGLDSSIVSTLAVEEVGEIDTFSVAFEEVPDSYHGCANEADAARRHAERIGSRHHVVYATAQSFREDLDCFCRYGDQPFAVSSGLGILAVARNAHEAGIKVLLGGDGADECFGGYSWYFHLRAAEEGSADPTGPPDRVVSFQNTGERLDFRLRVLGGYGPQLRAWAWHYYAHETEKAELFTPAFAEGLESSLRHFHRFDGSPQWSAEDFVAQDRDFYFPNEMLRKVDRMTMAFSVEGRSPFAAPSVLAHAGRLSYKHMVREGHLKWVLREAFRDVIPDEVLARPKHGFNVPIDRWLRGEWSDLVDETFSPASALCRHGIVGNSAGGAARTLLADPRRLNGHTVFCFVMLNRWLEHEANGNHR